MSAPTVAVSRGAGNERRDVLRGLVLCGLLMTAGSGAGILAASFRASTSLLSGLGYGTAFACAQERKRPFAARWALSAALVWFASFTPYVLMWNRELVRTYALAIGILLLIRHARAERLMRWAALSVALGVLLLTLYWSVPSGALPTPFAGLEGEWRAFQPRRWDESALTVCLFLLGSYASRGGVSGVLRKPAPELAWIGGAALFLGLGAAALHGFAPELNRDFGPSVPNPLVELSGRVGSTALAVSYLTGALLLCAHERLRRMLQPVGALGRMALTTILVQSLFGWIVMTAAPQLWLEEWRRLLFLDTLLVAQMVFSVLWLRDRNLGPAEHAMWGLTSLGWQLRRTLMPATGP